MLPIQESNLKSLRYLSLLLAVVALPAFAADADNGKRLAQAHCAACHIIVASNWRGEVADSPPFEIIAKKYGLDPELIAAHVINPRPDFADLQLSLRSGLRLPDPRRYN